MGKRSRQCNKLSVDQKQTVREVEILKMIFTKINFKVYENIEDEFVVYLLEHKFEELFLELSGKCFENEAANPKAFVVSYLTALIEKEDLKLKKELEEEIKELEEEVKELELTERQAQLGASKKELKKSIPVTNQRKNCRRNSHKNLNLDEPHFEKMSDKMTISQNPIDEAGSSKNEHQEDAPRSPYYGSDCPSFLSQSEAAIRLNKDFPKKEY